MTGLIHSSCNSAAGQVAGPARVPGRVLPIQEEILVDVVRPL